jgi:hypothetical protein
VPRDAERGGQARIQRNKGVGVGVGDGVDCGPGARWGGRFTSHPTRLAALLQL